MGKPPCPDFRAITANFFCVSKFIVFFFGTNIFFQVTQRCHYFSTRRGDQSYFHVNGHMESYSNTSVYVYKQKVLKITEISYMLLIYKSSKQMSRSMTKPTKWRATSKDSDQPEHLPSLIRVFAVRVKKPWALSYPLSASKDSDQTGWLK